ncbi:GntR family transcriptional regulator [Sneathiella sp.]|uniref:GntR family transcriptional regulator n=1 Tax=Sneathiella sp. TaxID=1964365 RepID=UPI002FE23A30
MGITKISVDRKSGLPLSHQIFLVLSDAIRSGRYRDGEQLSTEEELTHLFGVSRITIRRAMESLRDAGLIESGAGRRSVVRRPVMEPIRASTASIVNNIMVFGTNTTAKVMEFDYVEAQGFVREKLWDAENGLVQRAVRVRYKDEYPVAHLTSYVPESLARTYTADELSSSPLQELLARAGAEVVGTRQRISAALADPLVASRLNIKIGSPLIDLRCLMVDRQGRAVEYIEFLASPEKIVLRYDLEPVKKSNSKS